MARPPVGPHACGAVTAASASERRLRATFVDVRSPEEFRGELLPPPYLSQEQPKVPGTSPEQPTSRGARRPPRTGRVLPAKELRALYERAGVTADREVIAYCRIGERSTHNWFVLHELLGHPDIKELRRLLDGVGFAGGRTGQKG